MRPGLRDYPWRERHRLPNWVVAVRSDVGLVRDHAEDAFRVLPEGVYQNRNALALGVFDGLGGEPNGRDAAWAAADHLHEALAKVSAPGNLLGYLNAWVRDAHGMTTAVVALLPEAKGDAGWLLSIGDSGAYALDASGNAKLLHPKDATAPNHVTDCLGMPEIGGHALPLAIPRGGAILLCTDGVDGVVEQGSLTRALRAPDVAAAADDLLADVLVKGAPDNATVVLARRTA